MAFLGVLAELAEGLAVESGRLKKRAAIAAAILQAEQDDPGGYDAGLLAMYVAGTPFAEADGRKLNAGGALLTKALLAVSGAQQVELTAAYQRYGDLGAAGFDLLARRDEGGRASHDADPSAKGLYAAWAVDSGAPLAGLTLKEVAEAFAAMAVARTTAVRAGLVEGLLRRAAPLEVKYLL
jgi:DNA ligase-1